MNIDSNRWYEIDLIKAISILGVVYIHSISRLWSANDPMGSFLGDFTRFAVPGFVFSSGFLFKKDKIDAKSLSMRLLLRILPPYICCSLAIVVLGFSDTKSIPGQTAVSKVFYDLLFGNTIGIYYFVFVIIYLYALSFVLRILSKPLILTLWIIVTCITVLFYLYPLYFLPQSIIRLLPKGYDGFFFILMRHPCVHMFFYFSGWVIYLFYDKIKGFFKSRFLHLILLTVVSDIIFCFLFYIADDAFSFKQLSIQVHIILVIMFSLLVGINHRVLPKTVFFLSRNSYAIFLIHLPFVRFIQNQFPEITIRFSLIYSTLAWTGGIVGSILLIYLVKQIFRSYSPYVVGS